MAADRVTAVVPSLNLLRCFAGTGIPTVVVSAQEKDYTFSSRYCRRKHVIASPASDPEGALRGLIELGTTFAEKPVLYYWDDSTLLFVSRNREPLAEYYRFLLPPAGLVEALVDKTQFARLADEFGLPVPKTAVARRVATPEQVAEELSPPWMLKPDHRVGWFESAAVEGEGRTPRKALRADDPDELRRLFSKMKEFTDDFVVQEYIPGGDDCIYSFHAYFDSQSRMLAHYVGRKIRTYPRDCGVSTYLELVEEPELVSLATDCLARLGFVGVVKADFKRDRKRNRFFLLEVNPRFNLWNYLGAACGINLPRLAYADLVGEPYRPKDRYETGVRWLCFGNDLRAFLLDYHRDGTLSWKDWLLSFRGRKVHDIFSWSDPRPFLVAATRYSRNLLRRQLAKLVTA